MAHNFSFSLDDLSYIFRLHDPFIVVKENLFEPWGGSRGGSIEPLNLKEKHSNTCGFCIFYIFVIYKRFFIIWSLGKTTGFLFTLLAPKVVIFGNY